MESFSNKLNPLPIALSILSKLDSDNLLQIVHSAGVSIDLTLTKEDSYSHKTRKRAYLPRVYTFIESLDDDEALRAIYLVFEEILKVKEIQIDVRGELQRIGWDLINNSIIPIDSEVIELYFEKGFLHSAYLKIRDIVHSSVREVYIIDPYIDSSIFELFKHFQATTLSISILTSKNPPDYTHEKKLFLQQYTSLTIEEVTTKDFHDRFIIVDKRKVYHLGASIKDAGQKIFMINRIEDNDICDNIISSFEKRWDNRSK